MLPGQTHSHPRCPISLTPPSIFFFVSAFLMFLLIPLFLPSLAPGQRKALTPRLLPGLHCQLFFIFHGGGRASVESKRDREREGEKQRNYSVLPPPVSFSLISTSCPLLSHRADLHSSPSFPFNSPLLLPPFSSYLCLSFLVDNADMHPCTHAGARTRKDGITGSSRWKDYLLNQQETVSNSESIVTVLSI